MSNREYEEREGREGGRFKESLAGLSDCLDLENGRQGRELSVCRGRGLFWGVLGKHKEGDRL